MAYAAASSPECRLHAQQDIINHLWFMMSPVVCYNLLVSWLVSVLYTLWPPFFRAHRGFFIWAIGQRAEDFPFGWLSQEVEEEEDRRLFFLECCHKPHLLSPRLEMEKGQKNGTIMIILAYFLLLSYSANTHSFWAPTTWKALLDIAVNKREDWFSSRLPLHKVVGPMSGGDDIFCRARR